MTSDPAWVPDACTLPTVEQPLRVVEFDVLLRDSVRRVERPAPTRLELTLAASAEQSARDLAERESRCCSFFTFEFAPGPVLRIDVPEAYVDVLDALERRA